MYKNNIEINYPFKDLKKGYIYKDNKENVEYVYLGKHDFFSYQLDSLDYSENPCVNYKIELFYSKLIDKYKGVLIKDENLGFEEYTVKMDKDISFLYLTKPNIEYTKIGFVTEEDYNIILKNYIKKYGLRYFENFNFENNYKFNIPLRKEELKGYKGDYKLYKIKEYIGNYKLYKRLNKNEMLLIELNSKFDKKLDIIFFNNLLFAKYKIEDKNLIKIKEVNLELTKVNFNTKKIPEEIKSIKDCLIDFPMHECNVILKKIDFFKMIDYLNKNEFYFNCDIELANKIKIACNVELG